MFSKGSLLQGYRQKGEHGKGSKRGWHRKTPKKGTLGDIQEYAERGKVVMKKFVLGLIIFFLLATLLIVCGYFLGRVSLIIIPNLGVILIGDFSPNSVMDVVLLGLACIMGGIFMFTMGCVVYMLGEDILE